MKGAALPLVLVAATASAEVKLGANASLGGKRVLPDDNVWNLDVSKVPVDPRSDDYIRAIGADAPLHPDFGASYRGRPFGIPYVVVAGDTPRVPVLFEYWDESDRDYYPIPPDPPIEGGADADGDRHILILDRDGWKLFELYKARQNGAMWTAGAGAIWDLSRNHQRHAGWTSADAAGLPIFPGLARHDEVVEQKQVRHALRFTVRKTRKAYVWPATHWASRAEDPTLPPMGMRVRLKASVDAGKFPGSAQVLVRALQTYGMILADNGGDWFVSGAPDARWNDAELDTLKRLKGRDFEVIMTGNIVTP